MTKEQYLALKQWFNYYVSSFKSNNETINRNIKVKLEHNKRVSCCIKEIGMSLNLTSDDLLLAEIIGLFHDVGRFEQYTKYRTFSDTDSIDHGDLGVLILKKRCVLKDLNDSEKHIIYTAIANHNKKCIPNGLSQDVLRFAKLVRDADKADIYKVVTDFYKNPDNNNSLVLDLPDYENVNKHAIQSILNGELVEKKNLLTINDFKLLQLSWVFDLNYPKTLEIIIRKNYLNEIYDTLPLNEDIKKAKAYIDAFVENEMAIG
jgi:hypothetical protein